MPHAISMFQIASRQAICKKITPPEADSQVEDQGLQNQYWQHKKADSIVCQLPLAHPSLDDEFFFNRAQAHRQLNYHFAPECVYSLPYAHLISPAYVIKTFDNQILKESYLNDELLNQGGQFLVQRIKLNMGSGQIDLPFALYQNQLNETYSDQIGFLPVYYWHFNYHHWLIECLPLIELFCEDPHFANCKLILPENLNAFQAESLRLYHIPEEQRIYFNQQNLGFKHLYAPSIGNFSSHQLASVRQRLLKATQAHQENPGKRIYVSRQDANSRRIVNESELLRVLAAFEFEVFELSQMPLGDQIRLFHQASVICGPHGAGLSNLIFAPENAMLIELTPHDTVNHCFWVQANSLGQKYTYLPIKPINSARDMHLDPLKLQALFAALEL